MRRIPVDSTDARELRELEEERSREEAAAKVHDPRCRRGWLGETEDGHPIPCLHCRPHLLDQACLSCGAPPRGCETTRRKGGRCCPDCHHDKETSDATT